MAKIILNEKKYIEEILDTYNGKTYTKPEDLNVSQLIYLLAKYLYEKEDWGEWTSLDGNVYNTPNIWKEKEVVDTETGEISIEKTCKTSNLSNDALYLANKIDNILLKFEITGYDTVKMMKQIKKACRTVIKYDLKLKRNENGVPLLSDELENIKKCDSDRERKILFTCYIYARYKNKNGRIDEDIVKKKLFDMANVSGTKLELNKVIKSLREKGLISQTFINSDITIWVKMGHGEEVMRVTDFDTLGNQIIVYLRDDYKMCECCNKKLVKIKSKTKIPKYCKACKKNVHCEQQKNYRKRGLDEG